MNATEHLVRQRRRVVLSFSIAFAAWQLPRVLATLVGELAPRVAAALTVVTLVGALAFIVSAFRLFRFGRRLQSDAEAARALNDERVAELRLRSFTVGYAVMLGGVALLLAIAEMTPSATLGLLRACFVAGILAPAIYFVAAEAE